MQMTADGLLLQKLYQHESNHPGRVYMVQPLGDDKVREYSWAEVVDESRRVAQYLKSQGLEPGSSVAILSKNTAEFVMTDLAIWMAGYVSVAIYPTLAPDTIAYILEHSESKLIFIGKLDGWKNLKPGIPVDLPRIYHSLAPESGDVNWADVVANNEPIEGRPIRDGSDIAAIVYTSGSTGKPKGVVHNFECMSIAATGMSKAIRASDDERMLSYLPLAHVFERVAVECCSLVIGYTVFFAESLATFNADMVRARPTVFISVPRLWLKFQLGVFSKMPEEKLSKLLKIPIVKGLIRKKLLVGLGLDACRLAISGSAPLPPNVIDWYRSSLGLELLEGYGMSENFAYSHFSPPGQGRLGYVGSPLDGVEHRISDKGEIEVKSPANMVSYFKLPEVTAESFTEDGFLLTGDRGEIDAQGRLKITGRTKELFKTSKGKYVAPAPIENLLNTDGHIELCCVTGPAQPSPYALLQLSEDIRAAGVDEAKRDELAPLFLALLQEVNGQLDPHERLQFMVVVKDEWGIENEFLTPTMKIKRSEIEKAYEPFVDAWYSSREKIIWES